jgi:hypothetical protein
MSEMLVFSWATMRLTACDCIGHDSFQLYRSRQLSILDSQAGLRKVQTNVLSPCILQATIRVIRR